MRSLQDSGEPNLDTLKDTLRVTEAKELKSGDKGSLLRFMGLPLRIFEKVKVNIQNRTVGFNEFRIARQGSFFQPYLPLQQIDILSTTPSYLVGTTNQIFFHHKSETHIDVLVNASKLTQRLFPFG